MNYSNPKLTNKESKKIKMIMIAIMFILLLIIGFVGYKNSNGMFSNEDTDTNNYEINVKVETETTSSEGVIQILTVESQDKTGFNIQTMKRRLDALYIKAQEADALHDNIDKNLRNLAWIHIEHSTRRKESVELKMLLGPSDLSETLSVPIQHNKWFRFEYNPSLVISGFAVI